MGWNVTFVISCPARVSSTKPMIVYPIIGLLYFALCWPLSLASKRLEGRMDAALGLKPGS